MRMPVTDNKPNKVYRVHGRKPCVREGGTPPATVRSGLRNKNEDALASPGSAINLREAPQSWDRSPANKARRLAPHRGAVPTISDLSSCAKWQTPRPVAW